MKNIKLKITLVVVWSLFTVQLLKAQTNNALGAGPALNTYGPTGFGAVFQGQVKINQTLAFVPSLGIENPYVFHIDLAARYFFNPMLYAQLGGLFHIAGDGLEESGPGGTASIGLQLFTNKNQFFDINLHADYLGRDKLPDGYTSYNYNQATRNVAGIRITYNFILPKLPPESHRRPPLLPF